MRACVCLPLPPQPIVCPSQEPQCTDARRSGLTAASGAGIAPSPRPPTQQLLDAPTPIPAGEGPGSPRIEPSPRLAPERGAWPSWGCARTPPPKKKAAPPRASPGPRGRSPVHVGAVVAHQVVRLAARLFVDLGGHGGGGGIGARRPLCRRAPGGEMLRAGGEGGGGPGRRGCPGCCGSPGSRAALLRWAVGRARGSGLTPAPPGGGGTRLQPGSAAPRLVPRRGGGGLPPRPAPPGLEETPPPFCGASHALRAAKAPLGGPRGDVSAALARPSFVGGCEPAWEARPRARRREQPPW